MGIHASVSCNCYREGKASPFPLADRATFTFDPSHLPALTWLEELDEDELEDGYEDFRAWLATCCSHSNMHYAQEFIASWKGHQAFVEAIEALGKEAFPLLLSQLPDGEDGITSSDIAQAMLLEVADFEARYITLTHTVLRDTERDDIISMGSQVMNGVLAMDRLTGYDIGFNESGFFVRDRLEFNRLLFLATHVEQRLLRPELQEVMYVDRETGKTFVCHTPFGKWYNDVDGIPRMYLQQFEIVALPIQEGRFAYILEPLKRILNASIMTKNPIRWA